MVLRNTRRIYPVPASPAANILIACHDWPALMTDLPRCKLLRTNCGNSELHGHDRRGTAAVRGFGEVETWVFDLDNTLYPHHLNLWQQVDERIRDYIAGFLKVSRDEAFRLQKDYYRRYGTSMRGLMEEHGLQPDEFLEIVHQIDHSPIDAEPRARRRDRQTAGPQAHPHQRHAPPCRRGDAAARNRRAFRRHLRYHGGRTRAEAAAAGL